MFKFVQHHRQNPKNWQLIDARSHSCATNQRKPFFQGCSVQIRVTPKGKLTMWSHFGKPEIMYLVEMAIAWGGREQSSRCIVRRTMQLIGASSAKERLASTRGFMTMKDNFDRIGSQMFISTPPPLSLFKGEGSESIQRWDRRGPNFGAGWGIRLRQKHRHQTIGEILRRKFGWHSLWWPLNKGA